MTFAHKYTLPTSSMVNPQPSGSFFASKNQIHRKPGESGQDQASGKQDASPTKQASIWKASSICGRPGRENTDFPNTYIKVVHIDIGNMASGMTLDWENPTNLGLPTGPFPICPGAGLCCLDCDDATVSQTADTLCTPKGTFPVTGKNCVLNDTDWAKNPTFFQRSGIAIHAGPPGRNMPPSPGHPASHGCVRTSEEGSQIIHDNSRYNPSLYGPTEQLPDRRTQIEVSGTWSTSVCYTSERARTPVERAAQCRQTPDAGTGE